MNQDHEAHLEHLSQRMAHQVGALSRNVAIIVCQAWTTGNAEARDTPGQASFFRALGTGEGHRSLAELASAWAVEWEARGFLAGFHAAQQILRGR